jgi:hypothetical protein
MLEFKLNEENYFEFEMQITGDADTSAKPNVEFTLNLKNGMKMSFLAEQKDSVYAVTLPPLKNYMVESGEHDCTLSVILGDKYFAPYSGKCMFKEAAKPVVSNVRVEHKETPKPSTPTITFVQKDKSSVLNETPKKTIEIPTVNEEEAAKKEELKKESANLDKLLGKKKGK